MADSGPEEDIIDFTSDSPVPRSTDCGKPSAPPVVADTELLASLRNARLRQQTVSLILQDDPGLWRTETVCRYFQ